MRKNKKLLLASVAALGALAIGVGATSTFAWFQASNTANINKGTDPTGTVKASTAGLTMGAFTVTPVIDPAVSESSVVLSDKDGKVYTGVTGGKDFDVSGVTGNEIGKTYVDVAVKVKIDYTGNVASASEALAVWQASSNNTFTITISDETPYTTADKPSAAMYTEYNTTHSSGILGTAYGLKFRTADVSRGNNGWTNANGSATHTVNNLAVESISLENPGTFTGTAGNWTVTTASAVATFHVGIVGVDGVIQSASDIYNLKVTISGTDIGA